MHKPNVETEVCVTRPLKYETESYTVLQFSAVLLGTPSMTSRAPVY